MGQLVRGDLLGRMHHGLILGGVQIGVDHRVSSVVDHVGQDDVAQPHDVLDLLALQAQAHGEVRLHGAAFRGIGVRGADLPHRVDLRLQRPLVISRLRRRRLFRLGWLRGCRLRGGGRRGLRFRLCRCGRLRLDPGFGGLGAGRGFAAG